MLSAVARVVRRQQVGCVDLAASRSRIAFISAGSGDAPLQSGSIGRAVPAIEASRSGAGACRWPRRDAHAGRRYQPTRSLRTTFSVGVLAHLREVHSLEHEIAGLVRVWQFLAVAADERLPDMGSAVLARGVEVAPGPDVPAERGLRRGARGHPAPARTNATNAAAATRTVSQW